MPSTANRISAAAAGYMELQGAQKDADCKEVEVKGGVSTRLGCCNEFKPGDPSVQQFRCGMCKYVIANQANPNYFYGAA